MQISGKHQRNIQLVFSDKKKEKKKKKKRKKKLKPTQLVYGIFSVRYYYKSTWAISEGNSFSITLLNADVKTILGARAIRMFIKTLSKLIIRHSDKNSGHVHDDCLHHSSFC